MGFETLIGIAAAVIAAIAGAFGLGHISVDDHDEWSAY